MSPQLPPVATVTGFHTAEGAQVREVFSRTIARSSAGAQVVVTKNGTTIVDLAGGTMTEKTPVQVFSVSKLLVALAATHAHAAGALNLDAPLADYWPAFARPATRAITARMVLDHSSGIHAVTKRLATEDLLAGALDEEVSRQDPFWEPGTEHGYGAFTFGALLAGVFENGVGIPLQQYVAKHVVDPAGAEFWFGAPEEIVPRLATLNFEPPVLTEGQLQALQEGRAIPDGSFGPILADAPGFFTDDRVVRASWPALSGVSTARSLAKVLNAALGHGDSAPLLAREGLEAMIGERRHGMDRTLAHVTRYGSGVELPHGYFPYLGGRSFGHQGAGGSVVVADPDSGLVLAYTTTNTQATVGGSDQAIALIATARALLVE
jgi:CubicO group peptidase (beta-lactamase class C family)